MVANLAGSFSKMNSAEKDIAGNVKQATTATNVERFNRARVFGFNLSFSTNVGLRENSWIGMDTNKTADKLDEIEKLHGNVL